MEALLFGLSGQYGYCRGIEGVGVFGARVTAKRRTLFSLHGYQDLSFQELASLMMGIK